MALPRSAPASIALFVLATCCLVMLALCHESVAPLHGLHRVVRLPLRRSLAATLASFASRVVGTVHALVPHRHELTPIVLDEPDEDAAEWWGPSVPPMPLQAEPALSSSPVPVLAAPLHSVHVAPDGSDVSSRLQQLRATVRFHLASLAQRMKSTADADAST
jgi:hypothetical protein